MSRDGTAKGDAVKRIVMCSTVCTRRDLRANLCKEGLHACGGVWGRREEDEELSTEVVGRKITSGVLRGDALQNLIGVFIVFIVSHGQQEEQ